MNLLVYLRRTYSSPLPPTALLRRLEHTVPTRPTGLLWWLGIRYLPCWGKVQPTTNTFRARVRWGRSSVPVIKGRWQAAPGTTLLAGTIVSLTIHAPISSLLVSVIVLALATGAIVASRPNELWVPLLLPGIMTFFWAGLFWLDIRHAERYFQQALLLTETTSTPLL